MPDPAEALPTPMTAEVDVDDALPSPPPTTAEVAAAWLRRGAWVALIAAVFATPLVVDNPTIIGIHSVRWFFESTPLLKAELLQLLVFLSIVLAGAAVALTGRLRWRPLLWLPLALAAWAGVTTALSVSPASALLGAPTRSEGYLTFLALVALPLLVVELADSSSRVRTLAAVAVASGAIVAGYGMLWTFSLDWATWQSLWGGFRAFGTIGNPDTLGAFLAPCVFVAVGLMLSEKHQLARIAYAGAVVVTSAGLVATASRGALVAAVAGVIVLAALSGRRALRVSLQGIGFVVVLILAVTLVLGVTLRQPGTENNTLRRLASVSSPTDVNSQGRVETWRIAVAAIAARPIIGYGPDTFGLAFDTHMTRAYEALVGPKYTQDNAHNILLQTASDLGVPGLALLLALLASTAWVALPDCRRDAGEPHAARYLTCGLWAGAAAYTIAVMFSPSTVAGSMLLWLLVGALLTCGAREAVAGTAVRVSGGLLAAAAFSGALLPIPTLQTDHLLMTAANKQNTAVARLAAGEEVLERDRLNAGYRGEVARLYATRALQSADSGNPDSAQLQSDASRAIELARAATVLEPPNSEWQTQLASILFMANDKVAPTYLKDADAAARQAVALSPQRLDARFWYAQALAADGDQAGAMRVFRDLIAVWPSYGEAALRVADILLLTGKNGDAIKVLSAPALAGDANVQATLKELQAHRATP